jgi:DNA-binding PadR family transcriptional regulator
MTNLTVSQIDIIAHTLGVNFYHAKLSKRLEDKILPGEFYRNWYNYGTFTEDMIKLEDIGIIESYHRRDNEYFYVTEKGIKEFRRIFKEEVTDKYVPTSASQQRYQTFLNLGISFAEYLGIKRGII